MSKKQLTEEEIIKAWEENKLRIPVIEKVVVHCCVGTGGEPLAKAKRILEQITNAKPVESKAKKTIKNFGIKRGESIAVRVTLRHKKAEEFLQRLFEALEYKLKLSSIDKRGNISLGIKEHLLLPGTKYDPNLGVIGFDVSICMRYPGYRVIYKKVKRAKRIKPVSPLETKLFFEKFYNVKFV